MTLSDFSTFVRNVVKWLAVSIAVLIILWICWLVISTVARAVVQPKGERLGFGNLSVPFFAKVYPNLIVQKAETISLRADKTESSVFVKTSAKKFTEIQIKNLFEVLEISKDSKKQAGDTLTYKNPSSDGVLKIDTSTNNFTFRYKTTDFKALDYMKIYIDENQARDKANGILKKITLVPSDVNINKASVKFLKIQEDKKTTVEPKAANCFEVSYFRQLEGATDVGDPVIRVLETADYRILEFDYIYSELDPFASLYPIISPDKAWKSFKDGASFVPTQEKYDSVKIENMYLSHWEQNDIPQKYVQPVWVFAGKGKTGDQEEAFTSYLPAIDSSYLVQ